jgi:hypothetical protein
MRRRRPEDQESSVGLPSTVTPTSMTRHTHEKRLSVCPRGQPRGFLFLHGGIAARRHFTAGWTGPGLGPWSFASSQDTDRCDHGGDDPGDSHGGRSQLEGIWTRRILSQSVQHSSPSVPIPVKCPYLSGNPWIATPCEAWTLNPLTSWTARPARGQGCIDLLAGGFLGRAHGSLGGTSPG